MYNETMIDESPEQFHNPTIEDDESVQHLNQHKQ